jgi:periplasmic divalent cation tolerance protein
MKHFAVITTCENEEEAARIANHLLHEKLIACANWWPVSSAYWWEGKSERASEYMLFMKTTDKHLKAADAVIKSVHSYDNPEIIQFAIAGGSKEYLDWVTECVR